MVAGLGKTILSKQINEAGTSPTAPASAPADAQDPKLMVIAVHRGPDGNIVITPIDVEHDTDDLTPMTENELKARKLLDGVFESKKAELNEALTALYTMFEHRLYRGSFRSFENYCFAIYGTNRINDVLMKKARKRADALEADVKENS